jgi:hypothetical protein
MVIANRKLVRAYWFVVLLRIDSYKVRADPTSTFDIGNILKKWEWIQLVHWTLKTLLKKHIFIVRRDSTRLYWAFETLPTKHISTVRRTQLVHWAFETLLKKHIFTVRRTQLVHWTLETLLKKDISTMRKDSTSALDIENTF